tara:strand:- start:14731 stop:18642 length:3912 start_codon:yes stop_codon:yes gene_type:complete
MKKRVLAYVLVISLVALTGVIAGICFTQSGLLLAYQTINRFVDGTLSVERLEGSLWGPLHAEGINFSSATNVAVDRLDFGWRLVNGAIVINAAIDGVRYTPAPDTEPAVATAQPWNIALPAVSVFYPVTLDDVQITRVYLRSGDTPIIDKVQLQLAMAGDALQLSRVEVVQAQNSLALSGRATTAGKYPLGIEVAGQWAVSPGNTLIAEGELTGSLDELRFQQKFSGFVTGSLDLRLANLAGEPAWQMDLQLEQFRPAGLAAPYQALAVAGAVNAAGDFGQGGVRGELSVTGIDQQAFQTNFDFGYEDSVLSIKQLTLAPLLSVSQSVSITSDAAQAQAQAVAPAPAPTDNGTVLEITGRVTHTDVSQFDLLAQWRAKDLVLPGGQRLLASSGRIEVDGSLDQYQLNGDVQAELKDFPAVHLVVRGNGDISHFTVADSTLKVGDAELDARVDLDWQKGISWQGDINLARVNPALLWPQWPGDLSGKVSSKGTVAEDNNGASAGTVADASGGRSRIISALLTIDQVTGTLRGHPTSVAGAVDIKLEEEGQTFVFDGIVATIGDAKISATGRLGEQWQLRAALHAPSLGVLSPGASGSLAVDVDIGGPRQSPRAVLQGRADQVALGDMHLGSLVLDADADLAPAGVIGIHVNGRDLSVNDQRWTSFQTTVDGSRQAHRIELNLIGDDSALLLGTSGSLSDTWGWQGKLDQLRVSATPLGQWQLGEPTSITVSPTSTVIPALCLHNGDAEGCLSVSLTDGAGAGTVDIKQMPLAYLRPLLLAALDVSGTVGGAVQWQRDVTGLVTGRGALQTSAGDIVLSVEQSRETITLLPSTLTAELDTTGLSADLALNLGDFGDVNGEFSLPGWRALEALSTDQTVEAELKLSTRALALLDAYAEAIDKTRGKLVADLALSGRLMAPDLSGYVELSEGSTTVPELGLELTAISWRADTSVDGNLDFSGALQSGSGVLSLKGGWQFSDNTGSLQLTGENILVANTDQVSLEVSPDALVTVKNRVVKLTGSVVVPSARIEPETIPDGAASPSDDIVVLEDIDTVAAEQASLPRLVTRLNLILGDDVRFEGFGLRGAVTGAVKIRAAPEKLTVGNGVLNIREGVYVMRGKPIDIKKGRLVFNDSPIDDPGLDLRAERVLGDVKVGMRASGTLKIPTLTLYSSPVMSDSDRLAYLLLGRPLSGASSGDANLLMTAASGMGLTQGEDIAKAVGAKLSLDEVRVDSEDGFDSASLVLGRYLSPKLYLRYIAGLASTGHRLQLTYQLADHVEVQSETGETTSGDVFYTIQREPAAPPDTK